MWPLIKKELRVQFSSPVVSAAAALFLFLTGFAFSAQVTEIRPYNLPEASLRGMLYFISVILLFITPFLGMRSLAEEKKSGSMELLKTSPLSDLQIVLGKFASLWILLAFILLLTVEFPVFLFLSGEPDWGPMFLSYVGLFLLGGAFLSVGIFASSLTSSQMIAALLSFVILITLWFLSDGGSWGEKVSVISHIESFSTGVLDLADVSYYLLFIFLFLFLTVRKLEAERWR